MNIKDLVWQIKNRETKKKFVELNIIKKIISENIVELRLLVSMKIHLIVNMSRIVLYQEQTEGQKKIPPSPVKIEREKEGRKNIE